MPSEPHEGLGRSLTGAEAVTFKSRLLRREDGREHSKTSSRLRWALVLLLYETGQPVSDVLCSS